MSPGEGQRIAGLILAGGTPDDPLAASWGIPVKALIPVAGRPMVQYVAQALCEAGLAPVVVATTAGAEAAIQAVVDDLNAVGTPLCIAVADGPRFTDTLQAGLGPLATERPVLVATGDLPLLTAQAVEDFLTQAQATGADLVYSAVLVKHLTGAYAEAPRTAVRLREGKVTGGNLALSRPEVWRAAMARVEQAFAGRKSPLALARMLGLGFIVGLCLGRLSIPAIVRRGERVLGCRAAVVLSRYPEICFDVDKPAHIEAAERILASRATDGQG
ncbi:MAG: nucleotidyltransferase family protein [Armatimonadetes bacterium]|nr:nucleotidyltransferase family protein [Armatimonadota bacterium]